jgi:hypothetical protein
MVKTLIKNKTDMDLNFKINKKISCSIHWRKNLKHHTEKNMSTVALFTNKAKNFEISASFGRI